jgi:hypothetical protein
VKSIIYAGETPHTVTLFAFDDLVDTVSGAMVVILRSAWKH